jgi:hypothetical protein
MAYGKITYNGYKYYRVDQKWWIKVSFESPYPLYFDYILSLVKLFNFQFDSNDVKVLKIFISKLGHHFKLFLHIFMKD